MEAMAIISAPHDAYLNDTSKIAQLTPSGVANNKYRSTFDGGSGGFSFGAIMNSAYFGSDPNTNGAVIGMMAYVVKTGSISTQSISILAPASPGSTSISETKMVCIAPKTNNACGAARTFSAGHIKYSFFMSTMGSGYTFSNEWQFLGIRTKLAFHNVVVSGCTFNNGSRTLDTIGTEDVWNIKFTVGTGTSQRELSFDYPNQYNVGHVSSLMGLNESTGPSIPEYTRTVHIKASQASATSLYVDYLFSASDFQTKDRYMIYDPTVTETSSGSTGGGGGGGGGSTTAAPAPATALVAGTRQHHIAALLMTLLLFVVL